MNLMGDIDAFYTESFYEKRIRPIFFGVLISYSIGIIILAIFVRLFVLSKDYVYIALYGILVIVAMIGVWEIIDFMSLTKRYNKAREDLMILRRRLYGGK